MKWAVRVLYVAWILLSHSVGRVMFLSSRRLSEELSPIALPTRPKPSPDVMLRLERRALRVSNRNRKQAAQYLATHRALTNSNSFEG